MSVRLTSKTIEAAYEAAEEFNPLRPPLLTGSTAILGEGSDIDVVVLVADMEVHPPGWMSCEGDYIRIGESEAFRVGKFAAYRAGEVNVIAVQDQTEFSGWLLATAVAMHADKDWMRVKDNRVMLFSSIKSWVEDYATKGE